MRSANTELDMLSKTRKVVAEDRIRRNQGTPNQYHKNPRAPRRGYKAGSQQSQGRPSPPSQATQTYAGSGCGGGGSGGGRGAVIYNPPPTYPGRPNFP